mmetsp:Transcript_88743/g.254114  ORF Transcript_88743/g.254114 Transcript_88743/m.254114 type:complete len:236 (+) Transcript_88743:722-1429(+)
MRGAAATAAAATGPVVRRRGRGACPEAACPCDGWSGSLGSDPPVQCSNIDDRDHSIESEVLEQRIVAILQQCHDRRHVSQAGGLNDHSVKWPRRSAPHEALQGCNEVDLAGAAEAPVRELDDPVVVCVRHHRAIDAQSSELVLDDSDPLQSGCQRCIQARRLASAQEARQHCHRRRPRRCHCRRGPAARGCRNALSSIVDRGRCCRRRHADACRAASGARALCLGSGRAQAWATT